MTDPTHRPVIAMLTDFGLADWFVGTMKGVILSISPEAHLVDICHEVERHRVEDAAFILNVSHRYFAPGTIFVCVVDPGVGSMRAPLIAWNGKCWFLAPDNGLLTYVQSQAENWEVRRIDNTDFMLPGPSQTFHGRDIFAPAAAHLAQGSPFEEFGPPAQKTVLLPFVENVRLDGNKLAGRVIYIDHYGNLLSNVTQAMLPGDIDPSHFHLHYKGRSIQGIQPHFASVPLQHPLMYWGSSGVLEIAVNQGSAQRKWSAQIGEWFDLEWE